MSEAAAMLPNRMKSRRVTPLLYNERVIRALSLDRAEAMQTIAMAFLGALATAFAAQLAVPMFPVPMTMQTLAVTSCGLLLGARAGAMSQVMYLAAGAAGAPVFANFAAGPQHIVGNTGGYLVGFVLCAYIVGRLAEQGWRDGFFRRLGAMAIGHAIVLTLGWAYLTLYIGAEPAFMAGVAPFIVGALAKSAIGAGVFDRRLYRKSE